MRVKELDVFFNDFYGNIDVAQCNYLQNFTETSFIKSPLPHRTYSHKNVSVKETLTNFE